MVITMAPLSPHGRPLPRGAEHPGFNPDRYTADLLLPVANFGERDGFVRTAGRLVSPTPAAPCRSRSTPPAADPACRQPPCGSCRRAGSIIEALGIERGHRTLVITRKGGKVVTIPLAPRTARAIDLATGERTEGPLFLAADGRRLDRHGAARIVRRVTRRAGIAKKVSPHTLRACLETCACPRDRE